MLGIAHATQPPRAPARAVWVVAVLVVLLLVTAFVGGFRARSTTKAGAAGLAPTWVVRLVDRSFGAVNTAAFASFRASLTEDAVLTDMQTGEQWIGASQVVGHVSSLDGLVVRRTSKVVYRDGYATFTLRFGDGITMAPAVTTVKIEHHKISHEWIMSDEPGGLSV
jgi:hypothetical protein